MGGHFELSDTGRTIRLDGVCTLLTVTGSKNVVFVRVASGASIQVTGDGNTVFWTLDDPTGAVPDVDNAGAGNSIRRG